MNRKPIITPRRKLFLKSLNENQFDPKHDIEELTFGDCFNFDATEKFRRCNGMSK